MLAYQELFEIEHNQKKFMLFLTDYNRVAFLEVVKGKYYYPELSDFKELNQIYNINNPFIRYVVSKVTFKEKVKVAGAFLGVSIILSSMVPNAYAKEEPVVNLKDQSVEVTIANPESNHYITTKDLNEFLGQQEITKEDIRFAIKENNKIPDEYKIYFYNFVEEISKNYPNYNFHIFYENVKDVEFIIVTPEEFKKISDYNFSGQYNSTENKITFLTTSSIETIYHEIGHMATLWTRTVDNITYYNGKSKFSSFDESMNNEQIAKFSTINSYDLGNCILKYLLSFVDFNVEDYSNYGIDGFMKKLYSTYPTIDFNYIVESLNRINQAGSHDKNIITIDKCKLLLDELFRISILELDKASPADPYEPFYAFAQILQDVKNENLVYYYLDNYNAYLQLKGIAPTKNTYLIQSAVSKFKEVVGIDYIGHDVLPVVEKEGNYITIDQNGNEIASISYYATPCMKSFITSTSIENYDIMNTSAYWETMAEKNNFLYPYKLENIPIFYNQEQIGEEYIPSLSIQVGLTNNNEIGYRIIGNGKILFESENKLTNLSNGISLVRYASEVLETQRKLELNEILNDFYLKKYIKKYPYDFKNIELKEDKVIVNPKCKVTIDSGTTCILTDITEIYINPINGALKLEPLEITLQNNSSINQVVLFKDVLKEANMFDEATSEYFFTESEVIQLFEQYLNGLEATNTR